MEDSKLVGTPMRTGLKLTKDDDSKEVDQTLYRSMIEKLQYIVHTRPNIALAVVIWRDYILCWSSDSAEQEWYLHHSVKVYQGDTQEVWYGRF